MGGATVRVKETVRVIVVLLAFIVTAYVPAVAPETLIDVAHEPELGMQESDGKFDGEKVITGPAGSTVEVKVVSAVIVGKSLFSGSTFTVMIERTLDGAPTITCPDVWDAERVKS